MSQVTSHTDWQIKPRSLLGATFARVMRSIYLPLGIFVCLVDARPSRQTLLREKRAAEAVSGFAATSATLIGSGQLSKSWIPGGATWVPLRRAVLEPNQRVALALAAGAVAIGTTRVATEGDGIVAISLRGAGRLPLRLWDEANERRQAAARRRRKAERQEWLRQNSKPSRIYRP